MKKYRNNTQTWNNLHTALSDDALSYLKYTVLGDEAEKSGYPEIAQCYKNAASNELARGMIWMDELGMGKSINEGLQDSAYNARIAQAKYKNFAATAEDEGDDALKEKFLHTADVKAKQEACFSNALERFMNGDMFESPDENAMWICYNCGHLHVGNNPPQWCPLCGRPETWFVLQERME